MNEVNKRKYTLFIQSSHKFTLHCPYLENFAYLGKNKSANQLILNIKKSDLFIPS